MREGGDGVGRRAGGARAADAVEDAGDEAAIAQVQGEDAVLAAKGLLFLFSKGSVCSVFF